MPAQESSNGSQKSPKRFRWRVLLIPPLLVYGGYLAFLYFYQHRIIFPVQYAEGNPKAEPDMAGARKIELNLEFGTVPVWFFPADGAKSCVLIAHGNAELAQGWFENAEQLCAEGLASIVVEYPGYGIADGSPSQKSIASVLDAAYEQALSLGFREDGIAGLGSSVGSGAICDLTNRKNLARLVLISPFRSLKSMSWKHYAPPFLVRSPFDNESALGKFAGPVLIFHGNEDVIVPISHGRALAELSKKNVLVEMDAGHNDIHAYWRSAMLGRISAFFRQVD